MLISPGLIRTDAHHVYLSFEFHFGRNLSKFILCTGPGMANLAAYHLLQLALTGDPYRTRQPLRILSLFWLDSPALHPIHLNHPSLCPCPDAFLLRLFSVYGSTPTT